MDLNTISSVLPLRTRGDICAWTKTSAWLAGGTWLFSEPQPKVETLLDLQSLAWPALQYDETGLRIAATCTLAQLHAVSPPPEYPALALIDTCCHALLGSFKVWNMATVGGNICLALPAGPMIALTVALEGTGVIWTLAGDERRLPIVDLVVGSQKTALEPGELLREIELPPHALRRRTAHRRAALSAFGRTGALLIGTRDRDGFALTVTGATRRPIHVAFAPAPSAADVRHAIDAAIPDDLYHDDIHGDPKWRQHLTRLFAEELREEMCSDPRS